ncbi:sialoadhesin-like [Danio rerio]|uniref:Sialoadhesin-like n=1 Tax=Danio rerio TaxID=7955 RepID=A0AC58J8W4_DANRE
MEISVMLIITGCLIQGVLCGFSISLPHRVEALKGSCVFIPCSFDIDQRYRYDLTNTAKRLWLKYEKYTILFFFESVSEVVVFDSSSPDSGLLKGEIFGSPTEKNCSTRFDNLNLKDRESYFFRIECSGGLQYSYKSPQHSQVEIAFKESPPKPTVRLFQDQREVMEMMEVIQVIEGKIVTLSCSMFYCPSHSSFLTWSSTLKNLINEDVTQKQHQSPTHLFSDLMFTVTHRHHRVKFTCISTHYIQRQITTTSTRQLHVQYAPKSVSAHVSPAGVIVQGHSVTLSCSSEANPAVKYSWYRHTEGDLKPLQTGPNLTIRNTNPSHSGRYYCRAANQHGTQNTSVLLDVQYAPKGVSAHVSPAGVIVEGHSVTLSCSSEANPAVKYSWYRHTEGDLKPVQTGPNLIISNTNLTISNVNRSQSGRYYCRAGNQHGTQNTSVLLDVQYALKSISAHVNGVAVEGHSVTLSCSSEANPAVKYSWYRHTEGDLKPVQTGPNLTINNINRSHSGRYYCIAENQHGIQNTSVLLDVQYAPKGVSAHVSPAGVIVEGHSVTLSCSSEANPAVKYSWYRHTEGDLKPVQTGPNLIISNTNLTISNVNRSQSGRYYCRAENQHGTQNTSVLLEVQSNFCLHPADD